jgi:hypothetical protein
VAIEVRDRADAFRRGDGEAAGGVVVTVGRGVVQGIGLGQRAAEGVIRRAALAARVGDVDGACLS